ncbi:peptidase C60B [[Clostridium] sordellii]|uniref:class B sortase n=2 Tax=Clostridia TaxID=186801 RepID=UPI0005E760B3|nr:class B sortase [Paeniclostridium sordellii]CEP94826.1 peptidase C60B [[Clostridium] sordellii] [Paeniclostridium sordellii]
MKKIEICYNFKKSMEVINIKILKNILKGVILIVFIVSGYNVVISIKEYSDSKKIYQEIREKKEDINLYNINSDYMGWINIENTPIDYPIVKGDNNEFYLTRDFNKQYLKTGSIFMDYRNEGFKDKNIVIYGHNMKDKSMFGSLNKFKNLDYLSKNKYISITTKNDEKLMYEIFGLYVTSVDDTESISVNFNKEEDFNEYIEGIFNKSIYNSNIDIKSTDKMLTLSTCSYEFSNARLVIHAKLIN